MNYEKFVTEDANYTPKSTIKSQTNKNNNISRHYGVSKQTKPKLNAKFSFGKFQSDLALWAGTLGRRICAKPALPSEPAVLKDRDVLKGGYRGTPLPILPDIRKAEVDVGTSTPWLLEYGINKMEGKEIRLFPGPNKKLNRYLTHEYNRMISIIGGQVHPARGPSNAREP